jgi:hypothetical protein
MGTRSSKPRVVIKPTRRPVRAAITLVTAVVPKPKRATFGNSASSVVPARCATSRQPAITPSPSDAVPDGALARHTCAPSESTTSVNVPPTSTPMQYESAGDRDAPGFADESIGGCCIAISW